MDRSVFGSAIKTYPSKNNRTSRYYRPSSCILQQTNIFDDDEPADIFDKLINEEKARNDFSNVLSNKTASSHVGNATSRKSSFYPASIVLQSIQNVDVDVKRSSRPSTLNKNKKASKIKEGKENRFKHSKLFLSDEDSENDLSRSRSAIYEFNPDISAKVGRKLKQKTNRKSSKPYTVNRKKAKVKRLQDYRAKKFGEPRRPLIRPYNAVSTPFKTSEINELNCDFSRIRFAECARHVMADVSDVTTCQNFESNYSEPSAIEQSSSEYLFKPLIKEIQYSNSRKMSFLAARGEVKRSTSDDSNDLSCCDKHKNTAGNEQQNSDDNASSLRADRGATSPSRFSIFMAQLDQEKSYLFDPAIVSTPERKMRNVPLSREQNESEYKYADSVKDYGRFSSILPSKTFNEIAIGMPKVTVNKNVGTHFTGITERSFSFAISEESGERDLLPKSVESETSSSVPEVAIDQPLNNSVGGPVVRRGDRDHVMETFVTDTPIEHTDGESYETETSVNDGSIKREDVSSHAIETYMNNSEVGHIPDLSNLLINQTQYSVQDPQERSSLIRNTSHSLGDLTCKPMIRNSYELDPIRDNNNLLDDTDHLALSLHDFTLNSVDSDSSQSCRVSLAAAPKARSKISQPLDHFVSTNEIELLANDVSNLYVSDRVTGDAVEESPEGTVVDTSLVSLYPNPSVSCDSSAFLGFESPLLKQAELNKQLLLSAHHSVPLHFGQDSEVSSFESSSNISEQFATVVHLEHTAVADKLSPLRGSAASYSTSLDAIPDSNRKSAQFRRSEGKFATAVGRVTGVLQRESLTGSRYPNQAFSQDTCSYSPAADVDPTSMSSASDSSFSRTVISKDVADSTMVQGEPLAPARRPFGSGGRNSLSESVLDVSVLRKSVDLGNISPIHDAKSSSVSRDVGNRIDGLPMPKTVTYSKPSTFEPLLEEDEGETEDEYSTRFESTRSTEVTVGNNINFANLTTRRRRQYALPTLSEVAAEEDEELASETILNSPSSFMSRPSVNTIDRSMFRQSFFLRKGKKWRRSFITLKNIRGHGLGAEMLDQENKGRLWKKNVEELISDQSDAKIICQELEECSTLRTGFDGTAVAGFEEGDTVVSVKCGRPEKARFSLCLNAVSSSSVVGNASSSDSSSSEDEKWSSYSLRTSNVVDVSCASFLIGELRGGAEAAESLVGGNHETREAGDYSRILGFPAIDTSLVDSSKDVVLLYCQQREPLPFETCFPDSLLQKCEKIGEGVYGEVFKLKKRSRSSVLKIIPIEGDQIVNGERQKKFDEILSELVISVQLSNLRKRKDFYTECFAEVVQCWCVYGRYPKRLLALWNKYDLKKGSDNDSPKMFKDDQLYLILELNDGGKDVESFKFRNPQEALSVFNQVSNALAVAESAFNFEHRDLHWGNILVTRVPPKDSETRFVIRDDKRYIKLEGVKATIIDYTLSRISIGSRTLYNNIGLDPELFTAEGDFQFEVYRLMRKEVNNIWDQFVPKTNVLWLFYLVDKLIHEAQYGRYSKQKYKPYFERLHEWYKITMNFDSSYQLAKEL